MGREIVKQLAKQPDMRLAVAIEAPSSPFLGMDAGEVAGLGKLGVEVESASGLEEILKREKPEVLVDFTRADVAVENVRIAAKLGIPVVVGTTGFSADQKRSLERTIGENKIPAVIAPNMSVGVNVFFKLLSDAARMLGPEYGVEIIEVHHRGKLDAPSGTALRAAKLIADSLGKSEESIKVGRPAGKQKEQSGEIYIHSLRVGDVIGEHTVIFAGPAERIELTHRAHSREVFAVGVIKAIRFLREHGTPGKIYDMWDVLGLKSV
jgi:4-hydroxy-tetrahydrodipicolinate reductase